jgi:hypothetical protein
LIWKRRESAELIYNNTRIEASAQPGIFNFGGKLPEHVEN